MAAQLLIPNHMPVHIEQRAHFGHTMCRYYGRNVGIKIMPTGVNCERLLGGLQWKDTIWRRGELKVYTP